MCRSAQINSFFGSFFQKYLMVFTTAYSFYTTSVCGGALQAQTDSLLQFKQQAGADCSAEKRYI